MKIRTDPDDTRWSKLVRERDKRCRKCRRGPPYVLNAHHIMPRGRSATRWDLANGMALCVMCHTFGDEAVHKIGSKPFMVPLIGLKEYRRLEKKSLKPMSREIARAIFRNETVVQYR